MKGMLELSNYFEEEKFKYRELIFRLIYFFMFFTLLFKSIHSKKDFTFKEKYFSLLYSLSVFGGSNPTNLKNVSFYH